MKNKLAVIIVNWNNSSDTAECIESVVNADREVDIYLVDNGSAYDDVKEIKEIASSNSKIRLLLNKENIGFVKAHNQVLSLLAEKYDYFFLLNNDTVIDERLFKFLKKEINQNTPDMVSCKMVNYFDHDSMDSAGHFMISSGEILPLGHGENVDKFQEPFSNLGPCAGAGLYSAKMLLDIGFFDEYFVTGYEDAELGLRAFIAGYHSVYRPKALVYHKMSQSIARVFNFEFALKTQCNVYFTSLKLLHWQVLVINFVPWLLKLVIILLVSLLFFRFKVLKVQLKALYHLLFREMLKVIKVRKESSNLRRISWRKMLLMQKCFLYHDIRNFFQIVFRGKKSYFENY